MHELSICYALADQVQSVAQENNAANIHSIVVGIGPLSGVEAHLLEQAWPIACAGTLSRSARLVIEHLPIRVQCKSCGQQSDALINRLVCGHCGDWQTRLISGHEMMLLSVELDRTDSFKETATSTQRGATHV